MNFLERKALKRATRQLRLPPDVAALDFDIGRSSPGLHSVLGDFAVRSEQIDLVCSTAGMHFHASSRIAKVPWSSIVDFEAEAGLLGSTYQFYLATSRRLSAQIKGTARASFGNAVRDAMNRYEHALSESEASARSRVSKEVMQWKEEMKNCQSRVTAAGWQTNSVVSAELLLLDNTTMTGSVVLDQIGVFVQGDAGRAARVPYESLGRFKLMTSGDALLAPCSLDDIGQIVVRPENVDVWLDDFELRRQDWWL